jgi:hypothetical protein
MKDTEKGGIIAAILVATGLGGYGVYKLSQKKTTTTTPTTTTTTTTSTYQLSAITAEYSSPTVNETDTFITTLTDNGNPVSNVSVAIYVDGTEITTATTDSSGVASFNLVFKHSGTHTLYCTANI